VVFFQSLSKNQDIIQVDNYNTLCYEVMKNIAHYYLKNYWAISYAKEYYQEFKKSD